jgi:hypothetical protein
VEGAVYPAGAETVARSGLLADRHFETSGFSVFKTLADMNHTVRRANIEICSAIGEPSEPDAEQRSWCITLPYGGRKK